MGTNSGSLPPLPSPSSSPVRGGSGEDGGEGEGVMCRLFEYIRRDSRAVSCGLKREKDSSGIHIHTTLLCGGESERLSQVLTLCAPCAKKLLEKKRLHPGSNRGPL